MTYPSILAIEFPFITCYNFFGKVGHDADKPQRDLPDVPLES
jgi:hypothetical protein